MYMCIYTYTFNSFTPLKTLLSIQLLINNCRIEGKKETSLVVFSEKTIIGLEPTMEIAQNSFGYLKIELLPMVHM